MKPRVLQIRAPGINCERELAHAFRRSGAEVREVHVNELYAHPERARECDLFAIPGGFTYGDDLGGGRILATEMARYLGDSLRAHHDAGGSIFGVCNGFQVLVKAGLLPDLPGVRASLTWNQSHRFECRWTRLRVESGLKHLLPEYSILPASSAHAEGRVILQDPADVERLQAANRIAFRYANAQGEVSDRYPDCPNGSDGAIAGLVNGSGRIIGMMPHAERNVSAAILPDHGTTGQWGRGGEALEFFRALLAPYTQEAAVVPPH